jgi:hypothetical protein
MMPARTLPPQGMAQATPWQAPPPPAMPSLANLAGGVPPAKVRGVAPEPMPAPQAQPAPLPPPAPPKFVLPSPEALGIAANPPAAATPIDWNQVHARMEKLGVLRYEKSTVPSGGVRVVLLLPMADPTRGQPVEAVAANEGNAIAAALERAEAWMQQR